AEREERLWFWVDADGDGVRKPVLDSPRVDVLPGAPARLLLLLPSTARPGDTVPLTVALVDVRGNVGGAGATRVTLLEPPDGLELPEAFELPADAGGHARFEVPVRAEGVYRLRARTTA